MLLALDTATRHSGIALLDTNGALIAELNWHSADGQTTELLPRLSQLLAWHAVEPLQLRAIAVSLGPGSFTGVRVAVSAAKGMALAQGLPLIGASSLDVTAYPFLQACTVPVCAVVQAGRGRLCWAVYAATPEALRPDNIPVGQIALLDLEPPSLKRQEEGASARRVAAVRLGEWTGWRTAYHLTDAATLAQQIATPTLFVGELDAESVHGLRAALGAHAMFTSPAVAGRRAGVLAHLAWLRWQADDTDDPASLSPIYLREP